MIQPMTVMDDVPLSAVLETPEGAPEGCDLVLLHGETHHFDKHPEEMFRHIKDWMLKQK